MVRVFYTTLFALVFTVNYLYAQNRTGTIVGFVRDSTTKTSVEFATVKLLYSTSSTAIISGAVTNENGYFRFEGIKSGSYKIVINNVGFKNKILSNIEINDRTTTIDLGSIYLQAEFTNLEQVEVKSTKSFIEKSTDKKTYNTQQMTGVQGGTAVDVLKNVPSISFDGEGNVLLRNNPNVQILVDGKPSNLLSSGLQNVPSANVEKIEIINNPSVKYESDGTAGIINIITKNKRAEGINGNVTIGYGTTQRANAATNLFFTKNKLNAFVGYTMRNEGFNINTTNTKNFINGNNEIVNCTNTAKNWSHPFVNMIRIGGDYAFDKQNTLSVSNNTGLLQVKNTSPTSIRFCDAMNHAYQLEYIEMYDQKKGLSNDLNISFKHNFSKENQYFNIDFNNSILNRTTNFNYIRKVENPESQQQYVLENKLLEKDKKNTIIGGFDVRNPIKNSFIEFGARYTYRSFINNQDFTLINDSKIDYQDKLSSAYALFNSDAKKKIIYVVGLRYETFYRNFTMNNSDEYSNLENGLFYNAQLMYKKNEKNLWSISTSRRANRPKFIQLNPYHDRTDPYIIRNGNPYLNSEIVYTMELAYSTFFKNISVNASLFNSITNNAFTKFIMLQNDGVTNVTTNNIGQQLQNGIELILNASFIKKINITTSGNVNHRVISGNYNQADYNIKSLNYLGKVNFSYSITKKLDAQLGAQYISKYNTPQGEIGSTSNIDISARYKILKSKGLIQLGFNDILFGNNFMIHSIEPNTENLYLRLTDTRFATLSFTYRFGIATNKGAPRGKNQEKQDAHSTDVGQ